MAEKKGTTKSQTQKRAIVVAHTLATILGLGALAGSIALGSYKDWSWWEISILAIVTALVVFIFYGLTVPDEEGEEDNELKRSTKTQIFAPVFGLIAIIVAIIVGFFVNWPWWAILILAAATDLVAFRVVSITVYNGEEEEDDEEDKKTTATTKTTTKEDNKNEPVQVVNIVVNDVEQTTTTTTTKKKKKKDDEDDDDEGCGLIFIKIALVVIVVCAAYFTKPSDAKMTEEMLEEVSKEAIMTAPPRIFDFFVFKIAEYEAVDLMGEYSGVAIGLFGCVWVP